MSTAVTISTEQARRLTDRIKIALDGTWHLIVEAYESRAWSVLGYESWDAYCKSEFSSAHLKLPREDRAERVQSLRDHGLSLRATSAAMGISEGTVRNDLRTGAQNYAPVPTVDSPDTRESQRTATTVQRGSVRFGSAGKVPTRTETTYDEDTGEVASERHTIGMDGKQYARPEPSIPQKPKAEAITSQFSSAIADLNRVLDRLHRIQTHQNFTANKNQVATLHGNDLARAVSELQNLAGQLQ